MCRMMTISLVGLCLLLSACADEKVKPQKSPCAALDNGPCGPKRPVNGKMYHTVERVGVAVVAS